MLAINKKCYLGGGQLATLNGQDLIRPMSEFNSKINSMSEINSIQKPGAMSEIQVMPTTKTLLIKQVVESTPPTDEELDRMFSMDERSRPYTYDELRVIYYKLREPFKNLTSKQLWSEYIQYLTQKNGGANCSIVVSTQVNELMKKYGIMFSESILNDNKIRLLRLFPPFDEISDIREMYGNSKSPSGVPWQKLTQLLTYKNIYGMKGITSELDDKCDKIIRFLRFLYDTKKIKHIVFLQNNSTIISNVDQIFLHP